jgi:hypothetical protein
VPGPGITITCSIAPSSAKILTSDFYSNLFYLDAKLADGLIPVIPDLWSFSLSIFFTYFIEFSML